MKKALKYIFAFIFAFLIVSLFLPNSCTSNYNELNNNYDVVMENINNDVKVVDVRMLGAHDAFSGSISYMSRSNVNEGGIVNNGAVNHLAKGLVVRMSKAQKNNAKELLYNGVRYFDARITKINDDYYTYHGYLSNSLEFYLIDIIDFLETHPTEFIIFDIQEFYTKNGSDNNLPNEDWDNLLLEMSEIKNSNGKTILDFINYDAKVDNLSSLTVGKITNNKTIGGIIMLAKTNSYSEFYLRDSNADKDNERIYSSIRSYWHNKNSHKDMLEGIEAEYDFNKQLDYQDIFIVNQAQKTAFILDASIFRSLFSWSLIDMAASFNKELVSDKERFMRWLDEMPIFMVDFATSSRGDFNNKANQYIMEYNNNL